VSTVITATINGRTFRGEVEDNELLIDFLRDDLGLIGARQSCEVEVCGSCTVLVDGLPVSSCCYLACDLDGKVVETIEGLVGTAFHEVLGDAFVRHGAVQCGYCTPAMVLTAKSLLDDERLADEESLKRAMRGNLCRCTGYRAILDALMDVMGSERVAEAGSGR
jgi:aerobic-type carbon monoxide dehydrogenase small subunit (CoxS/CutS family)